MKQVIPTYLPILFLITAACSYSTQNNHGDSAILVTDFRDEQIELEKPAERVICLIESALSGIYMLKQEHKVIGIPSDIYQEHLHRYYAQLDPRIAQKELPTPGSWDFVSIEQIVSLDPDLVIIWASQTEAIENIEQFGIPVYAVMLHSFNDVFKEITDLGIMLDGRPRAEQLIRHTRNRLESIRREYDNPEPRKVYFMWAQGLTETSGTNSTVNELLTTSGTVNACDMQEEHVTVSVEKIYDWNPDLIVMWYNDKLDPSDILSNPLLQGLPAVQNGQVYELPEVFACDFWTLKMSYTSELIGHWAYPDKHDRSTLPSQALNKMYSTLYDQSLR